MDNKRVAIAVGGTGGHVYPAVALAQQLKKQGIEVELIGGGLASNEYLSHVGLPRAEVSVGKLSGQGPIQKLLSAGRMGKGTLEARRLLSSFKADAVVGFGSYHSFPVLMAARLQGIPIVLHEGNGVPGRVNRFFSNSARMTVVSVPEAAKRIKGRTLVARPLLREGYHFEPQQKSRARLDYGLQPDKFTFLITGGSQGAVALNLLASVALTEHLGQHAQHIQVIHLTGSVDLAASIREQYEEHGIASVVKSFETDMQRAWQAADLAICRAGAGTLAELEEFEVPAILIPYPHALDKHQDANASFFVHAVGGGVQLPEEHLDAESLAREVRRLIGDDRKLINDMREAIHAFKLERPERDLCTVVCETVGLKLR